MAVVRLTWRGVGKKRSSERQLVRFVYSAVRSASSEKRLPCSVGLRRGTADGKLRPSKREVRKDKGRPGEVWCGEVR